MCLGVPGKVVEIHGVMATVDFFGVERQVSLQVVDEPVAPGDYVLNHVGFAIRRIPEDEIGETLALYERLIEIAEAEGDLMAEDVRGELGATRAVGPDATASRSAPRARLPIAEEEEVER